MPTIVKRKGTPSTTVDEAEAAFQTILRYVGEDVTREGLKETPARYIKALKEMTRGYREDPKKLLKVFEDGAEGCDQLVFQREIPFFSLCEHHCLPFFGVAHIGYVPDRKIVGLSKLARVVQVFSRRLQVQERLTTQIADLLFSELKPKGVGVVMAARHMCMECRGVQVPGVVTTTSALRGCILKEDSSRAEFLQFIHSR